MGWGCGGWIRGGRSLFRCLDLFMGLIVCLLVGVFGGIMLYE